jgi:hypothetical protein
MKILFACICFAIVIGAGIHTSRAEELEEGFMKMPWASSAAQHEGLKRLYENENISYYIQPHIVHKIREIPVPNVVYGFHEDRFFGVYIQLESEVVFGAFRTYLKSKYGIPNTSFSIKTGETVYQWHQGDVEIKLKTKADAYRMALSFYYMPISKKVNEKQIENFHGTFKRLFPIEKNEKPEMIPLLQF